MVEIIALDTQTKSVSDLVKLSEHLIYVCNNYGSLCKFKYTLTKSVKITNKCEKIILIFSDSVTKSLFCVENDSKSTVSKSPASRFKPHLYYR